MKQVSILSLLILLCLPALAQQSSTGAQRKDPPPAGTTVISTEEARMKTLEDQVRTLAEQVSLLRIDLKAMLNAPTAGKRAEERLFLTSPSVGPPLLPQPTPS